MTFEQIEERRENASGLVYEEYHERASGLCSRCSENAALPDDEWCGPCTLEVELALAEMEDAA